MNVCFIGGGQMARALINGLLKQTTPPTMTVIEVNTDAATALRRDYPEVEVAANVAALPPQAQVILLAVKPQQIAEVARNLAPRLLAQKPLLISIAAGISLSSLSQQLGGYVRLVRVMPNTPALVGAGMSVLCADVAVGPADRDCASTLLAAAGEVLWIADEGQMDAVTALSGSGPAYVFYFIEAMIEAGRELGLAAADTRQLVLQTLAGATRLSAHSLAQQDGESDVATLQRLRQQVTSKGGTTEAAVAVLNQAAVKEQLKAAVYAACQRSKALGQMTTPA